jgi:PPK2 family polyphosphate:nucleotide phosphotransferase
MDTKEYRYSGDRKFNINGFDTADTGEFKDRDGCAALFEKNVRRLEAYQDKLYAARKDAVLILFQAMDAAGKDGAIKHVFSGLNPSGVEVYSFKQPTDEEQLHDYLWRCHRHIPRRGKIAIFNRSYYEDVLVAKVHKLYLNQNLPDRCKCGDVIEQRYGQIRQFERYLWENGITVLKFFLHVSKDEQKKQLLERIDDPSKNWKFAKSDFLERRHWDAYQDAYEKAINATATESSPWHVIPSDKRWYARYLISEIVVKHFKEIDPRYPKLSEEAETDMREFRGSLKE